MSICRRNNRHLGLKKSFIVLLVLALLAAVVVGSSCATTQKTTTTTVTTPTATTPTATTPTNKATKLILSIASGSESGLLLDIRTENDAGAMVMAEGGIDAKLWLMKSDGNEPVQEWSGISLTIANYIPLQRATIDLHYLDGPRWYYNPGILEVTLTMKDGTSVTAELRNASLLPAELSLPLDSG